MKINFVGHGSQDTRADHTNIEVQSLDDVREACVDAEATSILALGLLDFVQSQHSENTLRLLVSKLRRGGRLTLNGLDLREVCRQVQQRRIDLAEANKLIYDGGRCSSLSLTSLEAALKSLGLKIVSKACQGPYYCITAERP